MNSKPTLTAILIALMVTFSTQATFAQLFGNGKSKAEKPNADLVPQSAFMSVAAFPNEITSLEALKLFPHEIVSAWGKKEFGFDPMLIKQATFIMKTPESLEAAEQSPPAYAVIFHFEEMQGLSGGMIDNLEEKKIAGKTVYSSGNDYQPSFMVVDEATMALGTESYFAEVLTAPAGKVTKLMESGTVRGQLSAFVDVQAVEPLLMEIMKESENYVLAPPIERMKLIPSLLSSVEAALETKSKFEAKIIMHANSNKDAEELNEIIVDGLEYGRQTILTQMTQNMDMNDPVQVATIQYTKRMYEKYEAKLTPEVKGKDLTITVHEEILALPVLASMMGGMSRSFEGPERRMTPKLQLRITALSFHNYESAYKKFPSRVIKDENGNALFSGRTSVLPFIEQNNLYSKLKLDEPWNSAHNSEFTEMAISQFGVTEDGKATIRFPVFPDSLWDDKNDGSGFGNVTDGTSNTIMAVHVAPEDAINWADPTPWTISETDPMRDIFGDRDEVEVAMMDGSTRKLKKSNMTNEKLKAMLTISGGEIVQD